jgi:hypothetical protein
MSPSQQPEQKCKCHVFLTAPSVSLRAGAAESERASLAVVTVSVSPPPIMSLLLETSLGDIVIDLEVAACPKTCENFLKLCKVYYYSLNAFFNGSFAPHAHCSLCLTLVS